MSRVIVRGPVLEVQTPAELRRLQRRGRPIALVGWPDDVRGPLDARLTLWATACGCDTGAALMLAATALVVVLVGWDIVNHGLAAFNLGHVAALLGALIGGAVVGKWAGLAWAERQWRAAKSDADAMYPG